MKNVRKLLKRFSSADFALSNPAQEWVVHIMSEKNMKRTTKFILVNVVTRYLNLERVLKSMINAPKTQIKF